MRYGEGGLSRDQRRRGCGVARAREVLSKVDVRVMGFSVTLGDYREDAWRLNWSRGIGGCLGSDPVVSNHNTVKNNEREE